jgi:hypothetical protein
MREDIPYTGVIGQLPMQDQDIASSPAALLMHRINL